MPSMFNNNFATDQAVADAASVVLQDNLVVANVVDHQLEDRFATGKLGSSIDVRVAPVLDPARDLFEDGTTKQDVLTETTVPVTIEKHFYKQVAISASDATLSIHDYGTQVLKPIIDSLVSSIESYTNLKLAAGCGGRTGTSWANPTTLADCARANKWFTKGRINPAGRFAICNADSEEAFLQLPAFTNADYGTDGPGALREATLGRRLGMTYLTSPYTNTIEAIPGSSLKVHAVAKKGDIAIIIDGITVHSVIPAGAQLTIDGHVYYVRKAIADAAATEQPVDLVYGLVAGITTGSTVKSEAYTQSFVLQKSCAALAIIPPKPAEGAPSFTANYRGIGVRITKTFDDTKMRDMLTVDCLAGMRVLQPKAAAVFTAIA